MLPQYIGFEDSNSHATILTGMKLVGVLLLFLLGIDVIAEDSGNNYGDYYSDSPGGQESQSDSDSTEYSDAFVTTSKMAMLSPAFSVPVIGALILLTH